MHDLCLILSSVLPKLSPKDRTFAESLIANASRYGSPTDKQAHWMKELYLRAIGGGQQQTQQKPGVEIGSTDAIMAMFDKAAAKLKKPAIKLATADVIIKVKPARKAPGTLYVTEAYSDVYLGKVADGRFVSARDSRSGTDTTALVSLLRDFAADPAKVAGKSGRLMGKCSFCRKTLTDPRSTSVGYGPDCAQHYGLPWG